MVDDARRLLAAGRPVHRRHRARDPAPAVFALLDPGDARHRRWCPSRSRSRNLFTQGMVLNEIYFRRPAESAASSTSTPRRSRCSVDAAHGRGAARCCAATAAGRVRRRRAPCRSRRTTASIRRRWSSEFGADTARLFTMFAAPPEQTLEWSDEGVQGAYPLHQAALEGGARARRRRACRRAARARRARRGAARLRRQAHQTLAKVTDDIGRRRTFNTAIAAVMELLNALGQIRGRTARRPRPVVQEALEIAVIALSPIMPHVDPRAVARARPRAALIDERVAGASTPRRSRSERSTSSCRSTASCAARIAVPAGAAEERGARGGAGRAERAEVHRRRAGAQGDRRARQARQRRGLRLRRGARGICGWPTARAAAACWPRGCGFRLAGSEPLPALLARAVSVRAAILIRTSRASSSAS